jgi:t-SNARE complex subunit (syntaxin)
METRNCLTCGEILKGRIDKKFCDDACRSTYNNQINSDSSAYIKTVNAILRKNKRIIEDLIPENEKSTKVSLKKLTEKGYNFNFHTHNYTTKTGSTYTFCYNFGFLPLENNFYMLVKQIDRN